RIYKRWPAALLGITVESELRNHENFPANVGKPQIHLSLGIGEEPQPGKLLGHPLHLRGCVAVGKADQQTESRTDRAYHAAVDPHPSLRDPLEHHPHRSPWSPPGRSPRTPGEGH